MSKIVYRLVNQITQQQALNLKSLLAELAKLGIERHQALSQMRSQKEGRLHHIVSIEPTLLSLLTKHATTPDSDRCSAALQNNSHQHRVNGSYLLLKHWGEHPKTVIFNGQGQASSPFLPRSSHAIIIENLQNFLQIEQGETLLREQCNTPFNAHTVFIFGAGNQIANQLHREYLSQFSQTDLLLDFDLGGLITAHTLITHLHSSTIRFLFPNTIETLLEHVTCPLDTPTLEAIYALGEKSDILKPAAQLILKHQKSLEQESYL